jgi:DNA-binding GntR family transcriptional regulator
MVEAIKAGEGDRAAEIMEAHIRDFYDKVRETLSDFPKA